MKKILSLVGLLCMLLFMFYIDSTEGEEHHPSARILDAEETAQETAGSSRDYDSIANTAHEYLLEQTEQKDGWIIETYQEYKIQYDEEGREIDREPTGNFDYLRYQQ